MGDCVIPNCRKFAPASEPFCREHRGPVEIDVAECVRQRNGLIVQRNRLIAALTPSAETKAAYWGEVIDSDSYQTQPVSWTATKEIMALVRKQAGIE